MRPCPWVGRLAVHRLVLRLRQDLPWRHSGVSGGITWSPSETLITPGSTSTTTPAPSCPRTDGKRPSGSDPLLVYSSVWHTPVDFISTSTSPAFGPSNCTV